MAVMVQVDGKSLITIQVNFVLIWDEATQIDLNCCYYNFAVNLYHHSHFLAAPFDFTTFFTAAIFNRASPFFTARDTQFSFNESTQCTCQNFLLQLTRSYCQCLITYTEKWQSTLCVVYILVSWTILEKQKRINM